MISKDEYKIFNPAMQGVQNQDEPLTPKVPTLTFNAVEAAFKSGVFFAKHRVKAKAFHVKLLSFSMEGNVQDPIPFAVATTVAIYEATAGIRDYTEKELSGWEVVSVERQ